MPEKPVSAYSDEEWEQPQRIPAATVYRELVPVTGNYWKDLQTAITEGIYSPLDKPKKAQVQAALSVLNGDYSPVRLTGNYRQDRAIALARGIIEPAPIKKTALLRAVEQFSSALVQHSKAA